MKKGILIIFVTLFFANSYCQKKIYEATYSIKIIENERLKNAPESIKSLYYSQNKVAENMQPKLYFNDSIGEYRLDEKIIEGDLAKVIFCNCLKPIYTNSVKKMFFYNNYTLRMMNEVYSKEDEYTVTDSLDTNWKLTNEFKFIENYKVYKAVKETKIEVRNNQQKNTKTIIAWYCPEIPYLFGPKGYGGLPGLILELQDEDSVIGITSLKIIDSFQFNYEKAWNTGKLITQAEFNKITEKKHSEDLKQKK